MNEIDASLVIGGSVFHAPIARSMQLSRALVDEI
jgi:hypothetical protein